MAASGFDAALARVLAHEGGWSDHPRDPGGATMKGVVQRVYDGYRDRAGLARRSVRHITDAELKAIYRRQYWDAVRADDLPAGLDYCVFDAAVNSGPVQAARWLQRAAGAAADGQVGEATLEAVRALDAVDLIEAMCDLRLAMLRRLRTWPSFGAGWTRRVGEVRHTALLMAERRKLPDMPVVVAGTDARADGAPRALPTDIRLTRTPEGAGGLVAGLGGLGAVVAEQADRLAPLGELSQVLRWACAALMIVGIALTLGGAWRRLRSEGLPA